MDQIRMEIRKTLLNKVYIHLPVVLKITTGFWRSLLSVMVLGTFAVIIDYGFFFTLLVSTIGAFLCHFWEQKYKVFREFTARVSLATLWAITIEYTVFGDKLVVIIKDTL